MKRILLIATGGTIACVKSKEGLRPAYKPQEMLRLIPELKDVAEIKGELIMNIDSSYMNPRRWVEIAKEIDKEKDNFDGIVVLHGTDTMAYTSSVLSLMLRGIKIPVVLTGAMKSIDEKESDAKNNVLNAVSFACEGLNGTYVVFDKKIYLGSRITKTNPSSFNAFESINYPLVGKLNSNGIVIENKPKESKEYVFNDKINSNIFYLSVIPGIKPKVIDNLTSYDGIVIGGFGDGNFPIELLPKFEELLKKKTPLVLSSQCIRGNIDAAYEAGFKLMKLGAISSKDMTNEMTIAKFMWVLGNTQNFEEIKRMMYTSYAKEIIND